MTFINKKLVSKLGQNGLIKINTKIKKLKSKNEIFWWTSIKIKWVIYKGNLEVNFSKVLWFYIHKRL